jgi:hypothetical protein
MVVRALSDSPLDPGHLWLASWGSGVWQRRSSTQPWERVPVRALPVDYGITVAPDPYTAKRVLVGSWGTLYQSNDGATFAPDSVDQNPAAFAFDPSNSSVLYTATQITGVYKSTDGGATWSTSNGAIAPWSTANGTFIDVRRIVVDPAAPQTLYIGTFGRGVYKSTDGASSWSNVLAPTAQIGCLLVVPGSPSTVYVCVDGNGIQRTTDGAATWTDDSQGLPTQDVGGLIRDPGTGDLYVAASTGVYVKRGAAAWTGFDLPCLHGTGATAIVTDGNVRRLVVASGGGLAAHTL